MSNLVKHSQLREISLDLWTKAKERTDVAFKDVAYDEVSKTITFTGVDGTTTSTVELTNLAELQDLVGLAQELAKVINEKADKFESTDIGGQDHATKVVKLNSEGKLDSAMLPDLALTTVQTALDRAAAQDLVTAKTVQVGDVVVLTDEKNKSFMCKSVEGSSFEDNFLELCMADGAVKNINGVTADDAGEVKINATHIKLSDDSETVEAELAKKVTTINDVEATDGNIVLALVENASDNRLDLTVGDQVISSILFMTSEEVQEIKNQFV